MKNLGRLIFVICLSLCALGHGGEKLVYNQLECPLTLATIAECDGDPRLHNLPRLNWLQGDQLRIQSGNISDLLVSKYSNYISPDSSRVGRLVIHSESTDKEIDTIVFGDKYKAFSTMLERGGSVRGFSLEGADAILSFLGGVKKRLVRVREMQRPYTVRDAANVGFQRLMATVEGGGGLAVGTFLLINGLPVLAAVGPGAGIVAGYLSLRRAYAIKAREDTGFIEDIELMEAGLEDGKKGGWRFVASDYKAPFPLQFRSEVWSRLSRDWETPVRQSAKMYWFLDETDYTPRLTVFIHEK